MTIGKVIRKYRKLANLTQEEMAVRLGVTAPAVNKWEKENSCPDITLLAPIARLLNISLDTLLSFQEDLTEQEIIDLVEQAAQIMKEKSYEEVFRWMKQVLEQYPNCEPLSLNFAAILDAQGIFQGVSEQEKYEKFICGWYERALDSKDENIRTKAAVFICERSSMTELRSIWNICRSKILRRSGKKRRSVQKQEDWKKHTRCMKNFYFRII